MNGLEHEQDKITFYNEFSKEIDFAELKHQGQKREDGKDYKTHPIKVAKILREKGFGREYIITALYHDLLEDTDATYHEIVELSGKEVADAVGLLTKTDGYIMEEYIAAIKNNPIAHMVKLADRLHNLRSILRLDNTKKKINQIKETEEYFIDLARGTVFEEEINIALKELKENVKLDEINKDFFDVI